MTSKIDENVFQLKFSEVVGPFFLTPGALNHPVISVKTVDSENKLSKEDSEVSIMDNGKFSNDTEFQNEGKTWKQSKVYECQICHQV